MVPGRPEPCTKSLLARECSGERVGSLRCCQVNLLLITHVSAPSLHKQPQQVTVTMLNIAAPDTQEWQSDPHCSLQLSIMLPCPPQAAPVSCKAIKPLTGAPSTNLPDISCLLTRLKRKRCSHIATGCPCWPAHGWAPAAAASQSPQSHHDRQCGGKSAQKPA